MEKVEWKVEGMTCSNCALSVTKLLQKEGMQNVMVNPIDGQVRFETSEKKEFSQIKSGIHKLGYSVVEEGSVAPEKKGFFHTHKQRFLFTLPFTLILMLHMLHGIIPLHALMNPWIQLALCLPVFLLGMNYFGASAIRSLKLGIPNMNVLVALGAAAAFVYSLIGAIYGYGQDYLFFETSASIITLVFLGNYLEESAVGATQRAVKALTKSQKVMATMIAFDDQHQEQYFPIDNSQLQVGDLILIKTGEQVPIDAKIIWGEGLLDEAIISGESLPVSKQKKDFIIGGSLLASGVLKAQVTAVGKNTVLSGILQMVKNAQREKPPLQQLADKISAVFVPVVIGIAVLTFLVNYFGFQISFTQSLMRFIAVMVISCPCAMGLATPAAIAVGLGRAARKGILFRNANRIEIFKDIRQMVFDKTGTLTTGKFAVAAYHSEIAEQDFKSLVYALEKFSTHPIAQSLCEAWKTTLQHRWKSIEEIKGIGIRAYDDAGNCFESGSAAFFENGSLHEQEHDVYVFKNKKLLGWIDMKDEIRTEAKTVINWLREHHIKPIILSGDRKEKVEAVAKTLGIVDWFAEQSPDAKMQKIASLNDAMPTAMVGDGINDAPALAKASLGISLSEASQLAMQSADVILVNHGLSKLPEAMGIGKHTYITIKQNLFWAFAYNIVAIPIASVGLLRPAFAALAMGFSDVVLAFNSLRLFVKKVIPM
jgi:Cu+-exporting ATPase